MKKLFYLEWLYNMFDVYDNGTIKDAYDYATNNAKYVEGSLAGIYLYRIMLAAEMEKKETVIKLIEEAIIVNGFWYNTDFFKNNRIFNFLKDVSIYNTIIELCEGRRTESINNKKPTINIFESKEKNKGLLIALHGDQQEIEAVHQYWNPSRFFNYTVAIPKSSVISYSDGHTWRDIETGVKEIKMHYNNLINKYSVKRDNIIISAFSSGTTIALTAVVNEEIEVGGIILLAPPLQNIEEIKDKLYILKTKNIPVYIVCGDKDDRFLPVAKKLAEYLKNIGSPYKLHISSGTNHEYPLHFDKVLEEIRIFFDI